MNKKLRCILLIDDDEDDNFFHQIVLNKMNITESICIAENGFEAIDLLTKGSVHPELIFLDINMPRMDGWEFVERFSKVYEMSANRVVIIILSTSMNPQEKKRATNIPQIADFKTKPVTQEMLTEILDTYFSPENRNG